MKLIIHNESDLSDEHCLILCSFYLEKLKITEFNNHRYIDTVKYQGKKYKIYGYEHRYTKSIKIKNAT